LKELSFNLIDLQQFAAKNNENQNTKSLQETLAFLQQKNNLLLNRLQGNTNHSPIAFSLKSSEASYLSEIDLQNSECSEKMSSFKDELSMSKSKMESRDQKMAQNKISIAEREKLDFLNQIRRLKEQNTRLSENSKVPILFLVYFFSLTSFSLVFHEIINV